MTKDELPVSGRSCDGCTLCCKIMAVGALKKPQWQACVHCSVGAGCSIYPARPAECQTYLCHYLKLADVPDAWHPKASHMVIEVYGRGDEFNNVYVDPDHPDAWREEPFYSDLKEAAREAAERGARVVVHVGRAQTAIFPDRDIEFGEIGPDEEVVVTFVTVADGAKPRPVAYKKKRREPPRGPADWR